MDYKIVATEEMHDCLDKCVSYLLFCLKNKEAAEHLLEQVDFVYTNLTSNPYIYRESTDLFMKSLHLREAKVPEMDYLIIYKIIDNTIYILGIYHTLENYSEAIKLVWSPN